jgi:hypothetical protein
MKKSRIFMAAGALALVVAGVFATKANKKVFTGTVYYFNGSGYTSIGSCLASLLTTATGGSQATISIPGQSSPVNLYNESGLKHLFLITE